MGTTPDVSRLDAPEARAQTSEDRRCPDVAVVVAVYNPGRNIDGLIGSLDAQTLPADALQVVFVDDGSSDGTTQRLRDLTATRPTWSVTSIPNSGWPGRPRNIGLDLARSEYVFFADHDDQFFPDTLEHLVSRARRAGADVVYPKVVRRGLVTPYWQLAHRDIDVADVVADQLAVSRSVHKLFRRDFLIEHGIRFPEGKVRLEDHHFMGQVLSRHPRVSVVASRPGYMWIHRSDQTNTSSKPVNLDEYFGYVDESVDLLVRGADDALQRHAAQVSLDRIFLPLRAATWVRRGRQEQESALASVARFLDAHVPAELEQQLPRLRQWSVEAIHDGDTDLYDGLVQLRASLRQSVIASSMRWSDDNRLVVEVTATVTTTDGEPVRLLRRGADLLLPTTMGAPDDGEAATLRAQDLGCGELTIRHRATGVEWPLHGSYRQDTRRSGIRGHSALLVLHLSAEIDPLLDYFGNELATGIWDVRARVDLLGERRAGRARVDPDAVLPQMRRLHDREVLPYRTADGTLALRIRDPSADLATRPRVTGLAWHHRHVDLSLAGPTPTTELVVRARGSLPSDVLTAVPVRHGHATLTLPKAPAGTVLDLSVRDASGDEQRLALDVPDTAVGPRRWQPYSTLYGSFSWRRLTVAGRVPPPVRRLMRHLLPPWMQHLLRPLLRY